MRGPSKGRARCTSRYKRPHLEQVVTNGWSCGERGVCGGDGVSLARPREVKRSKRGPTAHAPRSPGVATRARTRTRNSLLRVHPGRPRWASEEKRERSRFFDLPLSRSFCACACEGRQAGETRRARRGGGGRFAGVVAALLLVRGLGQSALASSGFCSWRRRRERDRRSNGDCERGATPRGESSLADVRRCCSFELLTKGPHRRLLST